MIDEIRVGENFSPVRAKGFSIASVAYFKDLGNVEVPIFSVQYRVWSIDANFLNSNVIEKYICLTANISQSQMQEHRCRKKKGMRF